MFQARKTIVVILDIEKIITVRKWAFEMVWCHSKGNM